MSSASDVQISDVKKAPLLEIGSNNVVSSYGPKNVLRSKTVATSFSKSSFFIEVKGLSPNCLLGPYIELVVPMDIRFMKQTGEVLVINAYPDCMPVANAAAAGVPRNNANNADLAVRYIDSVSTRPNGVIRGLRSCVLSINGSSFSTPQVSQWIDVVERLWSDNRIEPATGWSNAQPPYTNYGHPGRGAAEKSRFQRCINTIGQAQVKSVFFAANLMVDCVYRIRLRTRLFLGPWIFSQFPGMGQQLDGNFSGATPYIQSLTLEGQWNDFPLGDFFSTVGSDMSNSNAQQSPADVALNDNGQNAINFRGMWDSAVVNVNGMNSVTAAGVAAAPKVALMAPYLSYQWLEPDLQLMTFAPTYKVAGKRLTCYEQMAQTVAGQAEVEFAFNYVKLDSLSQLYAIYVSDSDTNVGTAFGARAPMHGAAPGYAHNIGNLGSQFSNIFAPINWSSLRISLSTKSQILGNLTGDELGITEVSQWRKYLKYSGGMNPMDFLSWRKHSQIILFSAEEIGMAFGGSYQQVTLNISFKAGRMCTQTALEPRDYFKDGNSAAPFGQGVADKGGIFNKKKGEQRLANLKAHLVMFEPTEISLSEGACSVQSVMYSNDQAKGAFSRLNTSTVSGPALEQLALTQ